MSGSAAPAKVVTAPGGKAPGTMLGEGEEMRTLACDIAASFQKTTVTFLQQRTRRALSWLKVTDGRARPTDHAKPF